MAALCCSSLSALSVPSSSGRPLTSSVHLSRPAPLLAHSRRSGTAATTPRWDSSPPALSSNLLQALGSAGLPGSALPGGAFLLCCCRERASALRIDAFQIPSKKWWTAKSPPNVIHIDSVQQLVDTMVRESC